MPAPNTGGRGVARGGAWARPSPGPARPGPPPLGGSGGGTSAAGESDPDLGPGPRHLDLDLAVLVLGAGLRLEGEAVLSGDLAREEVERVGHAHRREEHFAPAPGGVGEVAEHVVVVGLAHL